MTHYTPLRTRRNGHLALSPQVLRLEDHKAIYRRPRTWRELAFDILITWGLPACTLLFLALCFVCVVWLGAAIDRAIRTLNGGL